MSNYRDILDYRGVGLERFHCPSLCSYIVFYSDNKLNSVIVLLGWLQRVYSSQQLYNIASVSCAEGLKH